MTIKPSVECAARAARQLRIAADPDLMDTSLGDPSPGRSALDRLRAKPPQPSKPTLSISASRGDDHAGGNASRVERIVEGAERRRRSPGARPCRGRGTPKSRGPGPAADGDAEPQDGPQ
jgi:hypothetical protein